MANNQKDGQKPNKEENPSRTTVADTASPSRATVADTASPSRATVADTATGNNINAGQSLPRNQYGTQDTKKIDTPIVIKTSRTKVVKQSVVDSQSSQQRLPKSIQEVELDLELSKRYPELNFLTGKSEKEDTSKACEEIELKEIKKFYKKEDPDDPSGPGWSKTARGGSRDRAEQTLSLWGQTRFDVEVEIPNGYYHHFGPKPVKGLRGKGALDLRDHYSTIVRPADLKIEAAEGGTSLFSHLVRPSLQECHPWTEIAELYKHDLPENATCGPIGPVNRTNGRQVGISREMRLEELKARALQNIIHHEHFKDVKDELTKRSLESTEKAMRPALLVHNGISFWTGIRAQRDHSWESQSERQWRLNLENRYRQTLRLHDLEVIFDTEVNLPTRTFKMDGEEVEISAIDYEASTSTFPFDATVMDTHWAFVKITLYEDGSKVYDVRTPSPKKPNHPIPKETHRHFVLSPLAEDDDDEMQESGFWVLPSVDRKGVKVRFAKIVDTFWGVVRIDLLTDGTKIYKIKRPGAAKPVCPIPQATHRRFVVSPIKLFD